MKTLILNGSPRKNGDTVSLINKLTEELNGEHKIVDAYYSDVSACVDCRYINNNSTNISVYLNELFHPRAEGFEAQLHIVRMIYDHIVYLNICRENLREQGQLTANLDACFLKWIGRYLKLYKNKLYDTLENTCSSYNNKVWLELKYLYYINYNNLCGDCFISINRNAEESKKLIKEKPFNVDEWMLLHKSIIKEFLPLISIVNQQ